jgi:pimeloyl-ACP methyl ester carboxylesterase
MTRSQARILAILVASSLTGGCAERRHADEAREAPAPAATATEVGDVQAPDGVTIAYEVAGAGEPALVFVHGWSCDRSYWRAQVDHFAAEHRVVALDLAGHGESSLERAAYTMESFGEDVQAVVEALDLRRVVLVGHSMGGPVIVEAARLMPDRVVAVVPVDFFNDVDLEMSEEEIEAAMAPFREDFAARTEAVVRTFFRAGSDGLLVERVVRDMAAAPPEVGLSAFEEIWRYDQGAGLEGVAAPIRVINSDLWPTDLDALRRHEPDVELAVVPASGHFVMMEVPDEVNRLLERAVSELASTSPREP